MKKKFVLLILLIFTLSSNVFAESKPSGCEVSQEYLEWLETNDEEKSIMAMPKMCKEIKKVSVLPEYNITPFASETEQSTIPSSYDLRNVNGNNYVSDVKDQRQTGTCWANSTMDAIESNILLNNESITKDDYVLSAIHSSYSVSEKYFDNDTKNDEGNSETIVGAGAHRYSVASYLTKLNGPVYESSFPMDTYYDTNEPNITDDFQMGSNYAGALLSNYHLKSTTLENIMIPESVVDVNDIEFYSFEECNSDTITEIKKLIMQNGAIKSHVYSDNAYTNGAYIYYNGANSSNHAITIIGWDDNVSKSNFKYGSSINDNGAFLIKNTWGTNYGIDGYYYVSYEDVHICNNIEIFKNIDFSIEDNVYYYDKLGYIGSYGWGGDETTAWAANTFSKKTNDIEILKEVSFATIYETDYEVYLSITTDLNNRELLASGTANQEGYTTIKFDTPILLEDDFSIIVKYTGQDGWPIAVQSSSASGYEKTSIESGKSFVSLSGESWYDNSNGWLDENGITQYSIPSIKAYTNNIDYDFVIGEVSKEDKTEDKFKVPITLTNITNDSEIDFSIKVLDSNEVDVTNEFIINDYIKANNYVEIEKKSLDTENGEYKVEITYDLLTYDTTIEVNNSNPTIELGLMSFKSNNIYKDDSKIYDLYGGTLSIPVKLYNLDDNELSVEITDMDGVIQDFNIQLNTIVNNETSIQITIPKNTNSGGYTVKVSNGSVSNQVSFKVYDFIEVEDITFKYEDNELEEIILLKDDSIIVEGIINNDSTITNIEYSIENSSDKQVASLISKNEIYGNDIGTVNLVATVGEQQFKIPITVIDVPNITYDKITYTSNVSGNNKIDNYFGGKIEIEKTTTNKIDTMMFVGMGNVLGSCISYDYDIENKVIINILESCGLSGGESLQLEAGNYTYEEKIYVFDTKETVKEFSIDYEIEEYIPLESITTNIEKINLKIDETYYISNYEELVIEPNDATNKNIRYVGYDEEIISINEDGTIIALKAGMTTIKVMSVYNEEIYDTINVMVNPNIKEIETNIQSNYNNKLYYGYGGKVTANITTENIIDNERLTIKYYKDDVEQNDMTSIFDTTNRLISNNETSIDLYVGKSLAIGKYKVELSYENAESKSFEFEVIEPKKVTSIEASDIVISNDGTLTNINYQIKPNDAFNQDVEFEIADTSIATVEDVKIKGLKVGDTTLTIKSLDGTNITKTVNVSVVEKSIVIDNIKLENDIIYETFGGKLSFRISLINIDSTSVDLEILDENNNIIYEENVTLNDKGYKDIEYDISKELKAGTYKIKVTDGNFEKTANFEVTSYKAVENLKFVYKEKELNNLILLNSKAVNISSIITNNDSTFKDVSYSIEDESIATITNEGLITGVKVGKTELIASVGFQTFKLPIEIIETNPTVSESIHQSNISNEFVDVKYGGVITNAIQFSNLKENTLLDVEVYDGDNLLDWDYVEKNVMLLNNMLGTISLNIIPDVFNKPNEFTSSKELTVKYTYTLNDVDNTEITKEYKVNLSEYNPITKINLSKTDIKLAVNETMNIRSIFYFEPSNATNYEVTLSSNNTNVASTDGYSIKALSEGTAIITVTSQENENIKATINVTVEKNDYLKFSNKVNIYNESGSKYLKGFNANNTYKELMNNIDTNMNVVLKESNGSKVTSNSSVLKTGMKLSVGNNNYDIVVKGDISGDGKMSITDLSQMRYHLAQAKGKVKSGAYKQAGDMNDSNTVTITDLSQLRKKLAGVN